MTRFLRRGEKGVVKLWRNTCALGTAGDKTILLFQDDQVRRQLFHDQN